MISCTDSSSVSPIQTLLVVRIFPDRGAHSLLSGIANRKMLAVIVRLNASCFCWHVADEQPKAKSSHTPRKSHQVVKSVLLAESPTASIVSYVNPCTDIIVGSSRSDRKSVV